MSRPASVPAPVARAAQLAPDEAIGHQSPVPWVAGALAAAAVGALGASQHVARAFAFDPRLGVARLTLPAGTETLLSALAVTLVLAALGVAAHSAWRRTWAGLPAVLALGYGAGLATLLGPTIVAPWGIFVWAVRFSGVAETQPVMTQALVVLVVLFAAGAALAGLVVGKKQKESREPSGTFGTAAFGDGEWFAPTGVKRPGHGIPVGYKDDAPALLYDDTGAHTFVCAPTGAGKTVGFAVPTLLSHKGSTVVLDVKGELFAVTARHRREGLKQRVRRIDPFLAADKAPADSFNPLDTVVTEFDIAAANAGGEPVSDLDREEAPFAFDNAKMISEMLVAKTGEEKEPFFVDNARQFLTGLVLFVAAEERRTRTAEVPDFAAFEAEQARRRAAGEALMPDFPALYRLDAAVRATKPDAADHGEALPLFPGMPSKTVTIPNRRRSLVEVRRLLMSPDEELRQLLDAMCAHAHPIVAKRGAQFARMDERTFSSVVATVRSHTEFLDSPSIQQAISTSTFDFRDLKDDPTSVFLVMPVERLDNYSRFVRVMIGCAQARLLAMRFKPKHPVLFLLDEFPRLQRFDKIDEGLSAHRGFGIQYLIIVQSVAQLEEAYGPLWRNFITNTTLQILWSPNDDQACKFISDAAGDQTVSYVEVSDNLGSQGRHVIADSYSSGSSRTVRETRRKLIEPDEARTLDKSYCFVFSRGRAPVILKRPNYLTDAVFRGAFDDNPFHGDGQNEKVVSNAGAAFVAASKKAYADPGKARRALLLATVELGERGLAEAVRSRPSQFGALAARRARGKGTDGREAAVQAAAAAARFAWEEGEAQVREMLSLPPAPDADAARDRFRTASEALYAYPAAARAQFAERCRAEGAARALRALRADDTWVGPAKQGADGDRRALLADFGRAGARTATLRGAAAAVGDEFA